ncbi:hypothetical protein CROQUDRAFT_105660 [Cronartium quercuum f. sp. fusiforme G11]|uniref:Nucleolar protein 12 n=1 Tax=Cronartium quercuum f. sp. fusiforme G11 TaxID=708437 RepID=A0A9P6TFA6_9BASI|nr:hypothetical protein CROQUDRAFT_105660 [Cronartium quercuum f. sp. fusiforme G11]
MSPKRVRLSEPPPLAQAVSVPNNEQKESSNQIPVSSKKKNKKADRKGAKLAKDETPKFLLGEDKGKVDNELDQLFTSSIFPPLPVSITQESLPKAPDTQKVIGDTKASSFESAETMSQQNSNHEIERLPESSNYHISAEALAAMRQAKRFAKSLLKEANPTAIQRNPPALTSASASQRNIPMSESENDASESSSEDESSEPNIVHETLVSRNSLDSTSRATRSRKSRPCISNETPEERNSRTVFVGNVNVECVKNKARTREFLNHLLNPLSESEPLGPRSRIESYRFRGLPLATPIVTAEKAANRSDERSKAWRETQALSGPGLAEKASIDNPDGGRAGRRGAKTLPEAAATKLPEVKFLTPNQKRKVGYVTGDLHPDAKCCVSFVVISPPVETTEGTYLSAHELAKIISEKSDGTSFMGHVLRCDLAGTKLRDQTNQTEAQIISTDEQRRTLYIGGLDFTEQEDSIRKAVEDRLLKEKDGSPPDGGSWVQRVRIIRDKGTALNKGFAYVLLQTQDAVEEMLALETFKVGKRKVRLQKYVVSGKCAALKKLGHQIESAKGQTEKAQKAHKRPKLDLTQDISAIYAGPDLSNKLRPLSKAERKSIKSSTPARVERRMLKKQAKLKIKLADQQVDRKIQAVKSRPLKKTVNKPTATSIPKKKSRSDKRPHIKSKA